MILIEKYIVILDTSPLKIMMVGINFTVCSGERKEGCFIHAIIAGAHEMYVNCYVTLHNCTILPLHSKCLNTYKCYCMYIICKVGHSFKPLGS